MIVAVLTCNASDFIDVKNVVVVIVSVNTIVHAIVVVVALAIFACVHNTVVVSIFEVNTVVNAIVVDVKIN